MKEKKKKQQGPTNFELVLTLNNGRRVSKKFETGSDMQRWAKKTKPRLEFYDSDDRRRPPTLSEYFERLRK